MTKPGEPPDAGVTVPLGRPKGDSARSGAGAESLHTDDVVFAPEPGPGLPPGTNVGRYVIEGPLGKGGMGVVYAAHDPELGRTVALKLLRPEALEDREGSDGRSRLVREAHAMAKLSHPNVVAIYDAGVYEDQVFLAVELVDGATVKGWLGETPRSWREILHVFRQAGRGLVAAHAAGLVHRDFKPENVLISRRGEVKVADFGLARAAAAEPDRAPSEPAIVPTIDLASDPVLGTPLTQAGLVTGTPAYMAPEQFAGRGSDARTDEFSFCVALYQSLYGELPFASRVRARGPNPIRDAPKGTRVPSWVRRALLRGLSIKPEDRYPTLLELLDALADDPAVRRRRWFVAAGMAAVVAAAIAITAVIIVRQRAAADPCHDPEGRLAGVWDDTVRSQVQTAFSASGAPDAIGTAAYAAKAMDRASGAWIAAYRDACAATHVRHAQPEAALHLRLDCLDDQRFGLRAAGEIMAHPDPKNLSFAIGAAVALPLPLECADARVLSIVEQPSPERRSQVEALRLELARGRALTGAARYHDALAILEGLPDKATAIDAPALRANALEALGAAYGELYDYAKAIQDYTLAERSAAAAHLDSLATQAAASVVIYMSMLGSPQADVTRWLDHAQDDLRRAGTGTTAEFYVQRAVGFAGGAAPGEAHTRRVLALAEELFGNDRPETLHAANEHAVNLAKLGRYDESVAVLRKAIAGADSIFGPQNQRALLPQVNLTELLCDLGETKEAAEAIDSLFARLGSDEQIQSAVGFAVQAVLRAERGETAESLRLADRAIDVATRLQMLTNPNWSPDLHRHTIEAYLRDHQAKVALDEYEAFVSTLPPAADRPDGVNDLRLGGWAYLEVGRPDKALPVLEHALELSAGHPFYPGWVARLRYQIAQALVKTGSNIARAEALARTAHDELQNVTVAKDLLAEIDAWRAETFSAK